MATVHEPQARYQGPERRRNRVYRTKNSEYYCRDDVCIAVRNRKTGAFCPAHSAIGLRMSGGIRFTPDGEVLSVSKRGEVPHLGENLFFSRNGKLGNGVRTSALTEVARPPNQA
jgi:hypothetical protein